MGNLPIRVPGPAHSNDGMLNRWCNEVRECLLRLERRKPDIPTPQQLVGRRPAFNLGYTSGGARIQYGAFIWQIWQLTGVVGATDQTTSTDPGSGGTLTHNHTESGGGTTGNTDPGAGSVLNHDHDYDPGVTQLIWGGGGATLSPTVRAPNVKTSGGTLMTSDIPREWYNLDAFGDVHLYWKATRYNNTTLPTLDECYVAVGSPNLVGWAGVTVNSAGGEEGDGEQGEFSVKIGSVASDGKITQDIASDFYWSPAVLCGST